MLNGVDVFEEIVFDFGNEIQQRMIWKNSGHLNKFEETVCSRKLCSSIVTIKKYDYDFFVMNCRLFSSQFCFVWIWVLY